MSGRKRILLAIFLLPFGVLLAGLLVPAGKGVRRPTPAADAPSYATRGSHPVGIRELAPAGESGLELTMWYPANHAEVPEETMIYSYPYRIKVAALGAIPVARFGGRAIPDAPADMVEGPYPLVILSPGFAIGSRAYGWLAEHLASYGLVVISPDHRDHFDASMSQFWQATITRPQEILALLAYADEEGARGGALAGLVDPDVVAVIGHSYGGYTALAAAGARLDTGSFDVRCERARQTADPNLWLCDMLLPHLAEMAELAGLDSIPESLWPAWGDQRIDAIVPMAGDAYLFDEAGLAEVTVPVMAIGGTLDSETPYLWGTHPTYEYVSSSVKTRITLDQAEHMIFTGTCEAIPWAVEFVAGEFCSDSVWDRYRAHDLIRHFTTAFLLAELKQDSVAAATLAPDASQFPGVTFEAQGY